MAIKFKVKVGREYEVQGRFAEVIAIEGSDVVCRDRFDNVFTVDKGEVQEKKAIKKLP